MSREEYLAADYQFLLDVILQVTGISESDFILSRRYPIPYCRAIVAHSLCHKGYTSVEVGRILGRNHSLLTYYRRILSEALDNPTYGTVRRIWDEFQSQKLALADRDTTPRRKIEELAEQFVGDHCRRECASCHIIPENCRYRQDERVFLAGAKAQLDLLKDTVAKVREITTQYSLLCDNEDMSETLSLIESELSKA